MTIHKVINNNQVICIDQNRRECVVLGTGIGFKAKAGQNVPEEKIEKIFRLESPAVSSKFQQLIEKVPLKHIQIADEIISYIKCSLGEKLDDNIYVSLTDHMIKYYFRIEFQEDSLDYGRFLTHLRFFAQRMVKGKLYTTEDPAFCEMIRNQYKKEYACVEKIREYIRLEFKHGMTEEEMMYLTVHIRRLVKLDQG